MRIVIISGRSGSGKTVALHTLEDANFYCIDNLPASLLPHLAKTLSKTHAKLAVSIDSRNTTSDLCNFNELIGNLKKSGHTCDIIYLDASDEVLIKRFSANRRKHPLTGSITLREAIKLERELLAPIAYHADLTLETSNLNQYELSAIIEKNTSSLSNSLQLVIQSFGFKFGLPPESDFVFDVRCLPNPYWVNNLRELSGIDKEVQQYLGQNEKSANMLNDIVTFTDKWAKEFLTNSRSYLTIAIGCTGGKHRSVFIANGIPSKLTTKFNNVKVRHRDLKIGHQIKNEFKTDDKLKSELS